MPVLTRRVLTRRVFLARAGAGVILAALGAPRPAFAQRSAASSFVNQFATELVGIVNGPQDLAAKKAALGPVIDANVDVAKIARFCLGRFWPTATPAQQQQYTAIFHQVLLNSISGNLGKYRGVTFSLQGETPQGTSTLVSTVINRPNAPAANVQWVVDMSSGAPKVVDVVPEGTSLRLTQRSDYASYLSHHGNDISALLSALQQQLNNAG